MKKAALGSKLSLEIEVLDDAHDVVEASHPEDPLVLELGDGALPEAVEQALVGAAEGDVVEVATEPGEAYGEHSPEAIVSVPRDEFPAGLQLEKGQDITVSVEEDDGSDGELDATVLEVNEDAVILDANHPLAGKAATFRVTVQRVD